MLLGVVVGADKIMAFKRSLGGHMNKQGTEGYGHMQTEEIRWDQVQHSL